MPYLAWHHRPSPVSRSHEPARFPRRWMRPVASVLVALVLAGPSGMFGPAAASAAEVSSSTESAIRDVIQRADQEQVQAIAAQDPSAMADTATSSHYKELVKLNQELLDNGVVSIQLTNLEWGSITQNGSSATATVDETWITTYADGTTEQSVDRNLYKLVQQDGGWKISADDHTTAQTTANSAPSAQSQPSGSPVAPSGSSSVNWSGYAATGGGYSSVSGSWTVPQPSLFGTAGTDAAWVGIGGVNSYDLIQAGTDTVVSGTGQARYQAWIEMLPNAARPVPLAVYPGDSVSVSIDQQGPNTWLIQMTDNTTGQSYRETENYRSSRSSAEWVVEAPSDGRGVLPLDNFGTIGFTNGTTVKNGQSMTIAEAGAQQITMAANPRSPALAVPTPLGNDGMSFSVDRTSTSYGNGSGRSRGRP